jgi:hypothetical protein
MLHLGAVFATRGTVKRLATEDTEGTENDEVGMMNGEL